MNGYRDEQALLAQIAELRTRVKELAPARDLRERSLLGYYRQLLRDREERLATLRYRHAQHAD